MWMECSGTCNTTHHPHMDGSCLTELVHKHKERTEVRAHRLWVRLKIMYGLRSISLDILCLILHI